MAQQSPSARWKNLKGAGWNLFFMYYFRYVIVEKYDVAFYEIERKGDLLPFTVFVKDLSIVGHRQFIRDLFVSRDWDDGRNIFRSPDVDFCFKLWDYFGLTSLYGKFTPEQLACPVDQGPPFVYRRSLDQVLCYILVGGCSKCKIYSLE